MVMIAIRAVDYPRFLSALTQARKTLDVPRGTALTSKEFKKLLKDCFELEIEVSVGEQIGTFYLKEEDAVLFVLRWS
jgi:hypothetical protein